MPVDYRALAATDIASRQDLFSLAFPETTGTSVGSSAHYKWKFRDYPATPPSFEYVGGSGGRLVAYYAALPYRYRIDGEFRHVGMVCDVMTHPDWRGKGLFTAIGRHSTNALAVEGLSMVTGYPVRPEVLPGHLKVGWRVVQPLPVWVRPLGTRSLLPRALGWAAPAIDPVLRAVQSLVRPRRGDTVRVLDRAVFLADVAESAGYADLLDRWMGSVPNALHKDAAFLRWRTGAPGSAYRFVTVERDGRLVGTAVARVAELRGIPSVAVLDFMTDPQARDCAAGLHHGLARIARDAGCDAVAGMCSVEWARAYGYARAGYLRAPATFSLIVKKLDPGLADAVAYDPGRWHVFWIDSDDL